MLFLVAFLILFFSFANNAKEQKPETEIVGNLQSTYLLEVNSPITPINERVRAVKIQTDTREAIVAEIAKYDWNSEIMLKIAFCESGYNPRAVNWNDAKITGYPSMGIFQINAPYNEQLFNIEYNIQRAWQKYQSQGLSAWKNCAVKLGIL